MRKVAALTILSLAAFAQLLAAQQSKPNTPEQSTKKATLKVVIYGLVAFVPQSGGEDLKTLFLKAAHHKTVIGALNATCTPHNICTNNTKNPFRWEIEPGKNTLISLAGLMNGSRAAFDHLCGNSPSTKRPPSMDNGDLQWVPCMKSIDQDYDKVDKDCLAWPPRPGACTNIKASLSFGNMKAKNAYVCHFAHKDSTLGQKDYAYFMFRDSDLSAPPAWRGSPKVIGDAIAIEFDLGDEGLKITTEDTSHSSRSAILKPINPSSEMVLVFSNIYEPPPTPIPSPPHPFCTEYHEHFEHYYSILEPGTPVGIKYIPDIIPPGPGVQRTFHDFTRPSCDENLDAFEDDYDLDFTVDCHTNFKGRMDFDKYTYLPMAAPHNQRECDALAFSDPNSPP